MQLEYQVSDGVCLLRLNAPPLNTLTLPLLDQLRAAVRQANEDPAVQAIVIAGSGEHFSAGADVHLFQHLESPESAIQLSRIFQAAFHEVEDSSKPVAAALTGNVVGGALELAVACHYRCAAASSRFSMAEVKLGINPAAGGTQRLPRLVGPEAALQMLLTAAVVNAARALELGLVDAVVPSGQELDGARQLLRSASVRRTRDRTNKVADPVARNAAYEQAASLVAHVRPEIVAPQKIIECVRTGLEESFAAGLLREQTAFAECLDTAGARNKIRLFFATRQTGKLPELADVPAATVVSAAVVGVGTMGAGIAQALLAAGVRVTLLDQNEAALQKGLQRIRTALERRVADGKLPRERAERMLDLLGVSSHWQAAAEAGLVVESVFEDPEVKRAVLKRLDAVCTPDTILATNTSTICLDALAAGLSHPERLIGLHFFNPAQRMPLVEVIRRETTSALTLATSVKLCRAMRKTPVLVRNREGFLVNRVFVPYLQEAFSLLEEGATAAEIDAAAVEFGFPMGPLALIDMAGLDILVHSQRVLHHAYRYHGPLSPIAVRLMQRGHLGQKTGAGVYRYEAGSHTPLASSDTAEVIAEVRDESGRHPREIGREEIVERLVLRMVGEAYRVLEEGIARSASDVDVAMVLGTGFPDFRGGVIQYARDLGVDRVRRRLEELAAECGERFLPSHLMREEPGTKQGVS
jgi:3-hydroxyacyl-CoA dehydrogenase